MVRVKAMLSGYTHRHKTFNSQSLFLSLKRSVDRDGKKKQRKSGKEKISKEKKVNEKIDRERPLIVKAWMANNRAGYRCVVLAYCLPKQNDPITIYSPEN